MSSSNFTDQNIKKHLNQKLSDLINSKYKCISNSIVVQTESSSFLAYVAKDLDSQLLLIKVQLSSGKSGIFRQQQPSKQIIQVIPIQSQNQHLLLNDNLFIDIRPSPYMKYVLAMCVYDKIQTQMNKNRIKGLFLASIQLGQVNQLPKNIKLINCHMKSRQGSQIKDVKWYPYAPLTLLILTTDKISVYKLDKNPYEPNFELEFKGMKVKNKDQIIVKDYFQKIQFAQSLNEGKTYSSVGKKFSLYAISNTGAIYLFFPFICTQTIIDNAQHNTLTQIINRTSPIRSIRQTQISQKLHNAKITQITQNSQGPDQLNQPKQQPEYSLQLDSESIPQSQLFHLNNCQQAGREPGYLVRRPFHSIEDFHVVTINRHTIFISAMKTRQLSGVMKIQTFTEDPYNKLIHDQRYSRILSNFNIQTVGELRVDKAQLSSPQNDSMLRVFYAGNSLRNQVYLLCNQRICYKITLDGLARVIKSTLREKNTQDNGGKLIEVDVMFQSKSKIMTLSNSQRTIYLIRYTGNKGYMFVSIPIHSIELRQHIRQTSQQTQKLFQSLVKNTQMKAQNVDKQKPTTIVDLSPLSQSTFSQLQTKLLTFTTQFKRQVQTKLNKIKNLYQQINHKKSIISEHNYKKAQLMRLVVKAQQNDTQIKQLINDPQKQRTMTQKDIGRRTKAAGKYLDELKDKLFKQSQKVKVDPRKRQFIEQCQEQADAVITRLKQIKQRLLKKRTELTKQQNQE